MGESVFEAEASNASTTMNPRFFTSKIGIILLAVIVASAIFGTASAATYNGLATKQNTLQAQWAQVENQYQRKIVLYLNW